MRIGEAGEAVLGMETRDGDGTDMARQERQRMTREGQAAMRRGMAGGAWIGME